MFNDYRVARKMKSFFQFTASDGVPLFCNSLQS